VANAHTAIDRRSLITGRLLRADRVIAPPGGEIASILVQARSDRLVDVEASIVALAECEIYGRDPGASLWSWSMRRTRARSERRSTPSRCCPTFIPPHSSFTPSTQVNPCRRENCHDRTQARSPPGSEAGGRRDGGAGGGNAGAGACGEPCHRARGERVEMDKAPCRFCGTGCSVMVATKENRVVATHGDIKSEVNRASTA